MIRNCGVLLGLLGALVSLSANPVNSTTPSLMLGQLQWIALRPPLLPPRTKLVTPQVRALIEELRPGGVILFQENLESPSQLQRLMLELQNLSPIPLLFAIDEEGGTVSRLARVAAFRFAHRPAAPQWAQLSPSDFRAKARALAQELRQLGFRVNIAPVADLNLAPGNPMRYRSFGSDPIRVGQLLTEWLSAFQAEGVASVVKHFPGLGTTQIDTHHDFVPVNLTLEQWKQAEGKVFHDAMNQKVEMIMLAHVSWPQVTSNQDTIAFSSLVLQNLIRQQMGYQGLLITDALDMAAITRYQTQAEAAYKAILAGVDVVAMSTQPREVSAYLLRRYHQDSDFQRRAVESYQRQIALKRRLGLIQDGFDER